MAEFIKSKEKIVGIGESIIFENKTDSEFSVSAGIVFRKSGLYDVSVCENKTIVSKVGASLIMQHSKGKWIKIKGWFNSQIYKCSKCGNMLDFSGNANYCPNCGADMREDYNG